MIETSASSDMCYKKAHKIENPSLTSANVPQNTPISRLTLTSIIYILSGCPCLRRVLKHFLSISPLQDRTSKLMSWKIVTLPVITSLFESGLSHKILWYCVKGTVQIWSTYCDGWKARACVSDCISVSTPVIAIAKHTIGFEANWTPLYVVQSREIRTF